MAPLFAFETAHVFDGDPERLVGLALSVAFQVFLARSIFLPLKLKVWSFFANGIKFVFFLKNLLDQICKHLQLYTLVLQGQL